MRQVLAILGTALFFVLAPGTVAGLLPWWISRRAAETPLLKALPLRFLGFLLVSGGILLLLDSFARFALQGVGTPAPVFPTRHLVVFGPYRHVRNPMYLAVVSVIAGQGLIFSKLAVLLYGALAWLCFHLFVWGYEEPTLRASFGAEYAAFCANVPRWIPRVTPWRGSREGTARPFVFILAALVLTSALGPYERQADVLGPVFARHGYVFLYLFRRGVGLSPDQGVNSENLMNSKLAARGQDARNTLQLQLLENREMSDALSGLAFLRALPGVDSRNVAVIGHSFGGSLTLLYCCLNASLPCGRL